MMGRRRYTADFKRKVVVVAMRGDQTVQVIAARHGINPKPMPHLNPNKPPEASREFTRPRAGSKARRWSSGSAGRWPAFRAAKARSPGMMRVWWPALPGVVHLRPVRQPAWWQQRRSSGWSFHASFAPSDR